MKKILSILVILILVLSFVACAQGPGTNDKIDLPIDNTPKKLATPENVVVNINAIIRWNAVENATSYELTINGHKYTTTETSYAANSKMDFKVTVVAKADGYLDSAPSKEVKYESPYKDPDLPLNPESISVGIQGGSQVNSNGTLKLRANVTGTEDKKVTWEIITGSEYATIDETGLITAVEVDGDKVIEVKCTSQKDPKVSVSKILTIRARTSLTQDMLDAIAEMNKISFVGFLSINLYPVGEEMSTEPKLSYKTAVTTAMDGTNWYAQYESDGIKQGIYYKNVNNYASQVGLSFMNDELFHPMLDENEQNVTWEDSGLYNNFKGLKVEDFKFDEDEWRWVYQGNDKVTDRMVASANPYEFKPVSFSLIIDQGEIMGIYAISGRTYGLAAEHYAIQELFAAIAYGETVEVPTIAKFSYDENIHPQLQEAIDNMHSLTSYTLNCREIIGSIYTSSYNQTGYIEKITPIQCHFEPYTVITDGSGFEILKPIDNDSYGYKLLGENFYNSYNEYEGGIFTAARAYEKPFDTAKPSFAFAPEIFRSYYVDEDNGTTTYYVDELMCGVASTFYFGLGNDVALYGIYATKAFAQNAFTPYVTVKDGYIVDAGFYFYLGYMYGVIELTYSDFNSVDVATEKDVTFEIRNVPKSWSELEIEVTDVLGSEAYTENALEFLKEFFDDENIEERMPFFGDPLGDTYGFAMTSYMIGNSAVSRRTIQFYYDVPLDVDYSIDSSIEAVKNYLLSLGFVKSGEDYVKDDIAVRPYDHDLDFFIYVYRNK